MCPIKDALLLIAAPKMLITIPFHHVRVTLAAVAALTRGNQIIPHRQPTLDLRLDVIKRGCRCSAVAAKSIPCLKNTVPKPVFCDSLGDQFRLVDVVIHWGLAAGELRSCSPASDSRWRLIQKAWMQN